MERGQIIAMVEKTMEDMTKEMATMAAKQATGMECKPPPRARQIMVSLHQCFMAIFEGKEPELHENAATLADHLKKTKRVIPG